MNTPNHLRRSELLAVGVSDHDLRSRVRGGSMVRLRRGLYSVPAGDVPEAEHLRLVRATSEHVLQSNVFSHVSAAVIHHLPVDRGDLTVVTMIRQTSGHGHGGRQLRVRDTSLAPSEIEVIDGLAVTTLERTVCDLARLSPFEWGVAAADAALHRGHSLDSMRTVLEAHPRLFGVGKARRVLSFADGLSESPAESISRVTMSRWGLPRPVLQFEIFDDDGVFIARSDFGWPNYGLVGEVDGRLKYAQLLKPGQDAADVVMQEKAREQRIRRRGLWLVRWGWAAANDGAMLSGIINDGLRNALPRGTAAG